MRAELWTTRCGDSLTACLTSKHRLVHHFVAFIEQQAFRKDRIFALSPGHDGDAVAGVDEMGGGSIDDDLPGATGAGDDVGFQACAVGDGCHQDFFAVPEVGFFHEIGRDGDAAFVFDVGISDGGAVELGFEEGSEHGPECVVQGRGQAVGLVDDWIDGRVDW